MGSFETFGTNDKRTGSQLIQDWLYGPWNEEKLNQFEFVYHIPLVRDYLDYLLDVRSDREYLERYGMDYSNIHDPRKLNSTHSGARFYGASYRMISSNIDKLY